MEFAKRSISDFSVINNIEQGPPRLHFGYPRYAIKRKGLSTGCLVA